MTREEKFKMINIDIFHYNFGIVSERTLNCLRRGNMTSAELIYNNGIIGLMKIRGMGEKSRNEIIDIFKRYGLPLTRDGEEQKINRVEFEEFSYNGQTVTIEMYEKLLEDYKKLKKENDILVAKFEKLSKIFKEVD